MDHQPSLAAAIDGGPANPGVSLWSEFMQGHDKNPQKTALVSMHQKPNHLQGLVGLPTNVPSQTEHLSWSYEQLRKASSRIAAIFKRREIPRGAVLVTFVYNCAEWYLLLLATIIGEITLAPLDPHLLEPEREDELRFYLQTLKPSVIVVADEERIPVVNNMVRSLSLNLEFALCLSGVTNTDPNQWISLEKAAQQGCSDVEGNMSGPLRDDPDRIVTILFTSGTSTGRPKGCPRTAAGWLLYLSSGEFPGITQETVAVVHSANFRGIAPNLSMTCFRQGATLILPGLQFSSATTLEAIETYNATHTVCVPFQTHALSDDPSWSKERVQSVRAVQLGGDVNTLEIFKKTRKVFPNADIISTFGMTEGGGNMGWKSTGACIKEMAVFQDVVSGGTALPGAKVKIVQDNDKKRIVRRGEIGELHIASKTIIDRYLNNVSPELFYVDNGVNWFITGDVACIDEKGLAFVLGRSKDMIKRGGIGIFPAAVESCLSEHTGAKAVVLGIPHATLVEEPYAVVNRLEHGTTPTDIENLVVKIFGSECSLGGVVTLDQLGMSAFPLNASAKVEKVKVRNAVLHYLSAGPH